MGVIVLLHFGLGKPLRKSSSHYGLSRRLQRGKNSIRVPFFSPLLFLFKGVRSVVKRRSCVYGEEVRVGSEAVGVELVVTHRCVLFVRGRSMNGS